MKTNRLFYLAVSGDEIKKINVADVNSAKQAIKDNRANYQLQAVWAPDVETARSKVRLNKAEAYKPVKNLAGVIRTCDGWFQITDKNNRQSHRCFIYKPACSPKKCKVDTKLSGITNPYQEDFPFLQFKKIDGKYKAFYSGTNDLYEINNIPVNAEFESPKSGYRLMLTIKPIQKLIKDKILPEQMSFTEPTQIALFGELKRDLSETQERQLLSWHLKHDFSYPTSNLRETMRILLEKKYLKDQNKNLIITEKGKEYLDQYHTDILLSKPKSDIKIRQQPKEQLTLFGKLSGYTATCIKFGKNKLGNRQCKKFAPTCGSAGEGCRTESAPIPGKVAVRTKKDIEIEAKAIAQMLADDANQDLIRNKELLRLVIAYGGIAPHRGGFLKEEYSELPDKYKRKEGIPLDELAQEMGTNERELSDRIYEAEAQFRMLKEMRKGSTTKKFKSDDFIDEAWNRMESGRGFTGLSGYKHFTKPQWMDPYEWETLKEIDSSGKSNKKRILEFLRYFYDNRKVKGKDLTLDYFPDIIFSDVLRMIALMELAEERPDLIKKTVDGRGNQAYIITPKIETITPNKPKPPMYENTPVRREIEPEKTWERKKKKIAEKAGQMTLFGGYKGYDEQGAIESAIKNIEKYQGKPLYIAATYTGIRTGLVKPPLGQQYYRVNPDTSVDFVIYSKGIITEKRILNPKFKKIESKAKEQMTLFNGYAKTKLENPSNLKVIPKSFIPYQTVYGLTIFVNPEGIEKYGDVYTPRGYKEKKYKVYASYLPNGKFILWETSESLKRLIKAKHAQMTLFGGYKGTDKEYMARFKKALEQKNRELVRQMQDKILSYLDDKQSQTRQYTLTSEQAKQKYENSTISDAIDIKIKDLRTYIYPEYEKQFLNYIKGFPGYDRIKRELQEEIEIPKKVEKIIAEKGGQMTLFGGYATKLESLSLLK